MDAPVPMSARPMLLMIARTSAKSRLTRPGLTIKSVTPRMPSYRTLSAILNAVCVFFHTRTIVSGDRTLPQLSQLSAFTRAFSRAFSRGCVVHVPSPNVVVGLVLTNRFWLGMTISVSIVCSSSFRPSSAILSAVGNESHRVNGLVMSAGRQ